MNPRMTVGDIIEEGMISLNMGLSSEERQLKTEQLLMKVQLSPEHRTRYRQYKWLTNINEFYGNQLFPLSPRLQDH